MVGTVEIMKPAGEDLEQVLELLEETYHLHHKLDGEYYVPWDSGVRKQLEAYVESFPGVLGARDEEGWKGVIFYEVDEGGGIDTHFKRCGVVVEFVVTEAVRGQGIGQALLKRVEEEFNSQGIQHIRLMCSAHNLDAHRFYEREGYIPRQLLFCKS